MKILIVLPFSGAQFTGGLAVVNEQLTRALKKAGHDVKLLTCELESSAMATQAGHGNADILVIKSNETKAMKSPGSRSGAASRKRLYELINSEDVLRDSGMKLLGDWKPDYILGHSRFSGPAAIRLKRMLAEKHGDEPHVGYFLHSYPPVEGVLLTGYDAFEEPVDAESSMRKLGEEKEWIGKADVVLAMGPLMRWGATIMLREKGVKNPRVHEVISGVTPAESGVDSDSSNAVTLLLSGRANAPVKGFQDIVVAALKLRNEQRKGSEGKRKLSRDVVIKVRGMNEVEFPAYTDRADQRHDKRKVNHVTVQKWTEDLFGPFQERDRIRIEVSKTVSQAEVLKEYRSSDAVLTAAYLEHFGLVPFEALSCGRPVMISELSGSGQFLAERFGDRGKHCVVEDFSTRASRPFESTVLESVRPDSFDARSEAWATSIYELVENLEERTKEAKSLRKELTKNYDIQHFAESVVAAFDPDWKNKRTRQGPRGQVEPVKGD